MNSYTPNLCPHLRNALFFTMVRSESCLSGLPSILREPEVNSGPAWIFGDIRPTNNSLELSHIGGTEVFNLASRLGFSRKLHASVSAREDFNPELCASLVGRDRPVPQAQCCSTALGGGPWF